MASGRDVLSAFERAQRDLRHSEQRLATHLDSLRTDLAQLTQADTHIYRKIAAIRLSALEQGEIDRHLARSERRALNLLAERAARIEGLSAVLSNKDNEISRRQRERILVEKRVQKVEDKLTDLIEEVAISSSEQDGYRELRAVIDNQRARIEAARDKARQSAEDRRTKGEPYRQDILFMYLWEQGYGTAEYRAGNLARMLDRWVAGLVTYTAARANFSMLNAIPERLSEHVEHLEAQSKELEARCMALEEEALLDAGIAPFRESWRAEIGERDAIDARLEELHKEHGALMTERAMLARGEDENYLRALKLVSDNLRSAKAHRLAEMADETKNDEDDALAENLAANDRRRAKLEDEIARIDQQLSRLSERGQELGRLSRKFRRSRYDSRESEFVDDDIVGELLTSFLSGALSASSYWRHIGTNHRYRKRTRARWRNHRRGEEFPWADFGGGFGIGTGFGGGYGSGGASSGGFGGGGFSTGGGFGGGGGGFDSGGGF